MKKIVTILSVLLSFLSYSQVGIGTITPNTNAVIELSSTNQGMKFPRLTTSQRNSISLPAKGLTVFDIEINCLMTNFGTSASPVWKCLGGLPFTVPDPPTSPVATPGNAQASITFIAPVNNGGSAITGYTVTSSPGGFTATGSSSPLVVTGLTNGTSYTFTVVATNAIGNSVNSVTSAAVIPIAITSLNCAGATNNGTLTQNVAASGVSSVISYTGGYGSAHSGQTVTSTGVTGLTATLSAGSFAVGAGTLTYTISGTAATNGTASFAISIGGQSCTLTRYVNAAIGTGSFSGKTCFDIALGNDNTNLCGTLSSRTATKADFTLSATHTQSYTFTPPSTVSNVRFSFVNTNGTPVTAISGNNTGNNISSPVVATVNYVTTNTPFMGLTNSNPATVDIYVMYNDGATNNGTDRQLKITANIKDCACCIAKINATTYKEFLCHNLGANTSLDPHDMAQANAWGLNGAYIQWGRRGPNVTNDSRVDWVTAANTANFAAAPTGNTAATANSASISNWDSTTAADNSWRTTLGAKTSNDPCPAGYRVPTSAEWLGVYNNNTVSRSGAWTTSNTYYNSAVHFGPNASDKLLTLPAAGLRNIPDGVVLNHGSNGYYWSSTENGTYGRVFGFNSAGILPNNDGTRTYGFSLRCIVE